MTHLCVSKLTMIGSDNGLALGRCQTIIWTNHGILLIWPLGTNFSEILIGIQTFSFKKMHLKMSSARWRPFCLGLNVLTVIHSLDTSEHWQKWKAIVKQYFASTVEPPGKARKVSLKLQNWVQAPFFTNHIYFTPNERPPLLKGHNLGWPL